MARPRFVALAVATAVLSGCGSSGKTGAKASGEPAGPATRPTIAVTSTAFPPGGAIPVTYSCNGDNTPPPLSWRGVPAGTVEVAVVVADPDAPRGVFYHWIVAGLPATTTAMPTGGHLAGGVEATGSSGEAGYTGMCPPHGQRHHYDFTVYALRSPSGVTAGMAAAEARPRIVSRAVAEGTLVGTFAG